MITSFILSQVGEKQNELVFSSAPIDKQELSDYIYKVSGNLLDKNSFYRCFRMQRKIVMAHYWRTTYREIKSGRHGLFVIIGFIVDEALLPSYDFVIGYCSQFLHELQGHFGICLSSPNSDLLFSQLQMDSNDIVEKFQLRFQNAAIPVPKLYYRKIWRIKSAIPRHIPYAIYCLDSVEDLMHWEIFFFEALHYIRQGCWDISSHTNTSPVSMRILNKKDCFPINCGKVRLKRYRQYPYLLVF